MVRTPANIGDAGFPVLSPRSTKGMCNGVSGPSVASGNAGFAGSGLSSGSTRSCTGMHRPASGTRAYRSHLGRILLPRSIKGESPCAP